MLRGRRSREDRRHRSLLPGLQACQLEREDDDEDEDEDEDKDEEEMKMKMKRR